MKIQIFSDLHLHYHDFIPPPVDSDIVVIAGDLDKGTLGLNWVRKHFDTKPVIYVLGNHEYFDHDRQELLSSFKEKTKNTNITLLENEFYIFENVAFYGATFWTNFSFSEDPKRAIEKANQYMKDFKVITDKGGKVPFNAKQSAKNNNDCVTYLTKNWNKYSGLKKVIVTHHAPTPLSLHSQFLQDERNDAFVSEHSGLIKKLSPNLWIHGNIHEFKDYQLGSSRIVCNPKGYRVEKNCNFISDFVVEI